MGHHYHLIECNLFSPWYSTKKCSFGIKQQSLTHSLKPIEQLQNYPEMVPKLVFLYTFFTNDIIMTFIESKLNLWISSLQIIVTTIFSYKIYFIFNVKHNLFFLTVFLCQSGKPGLLYFDKFSCLYKLLDN